MGLRRLFRSWRARRARGAVPPVGGVSFGDLRRVAPVSREFGYDRGLPVDRYYIERFLERHAADVRGHVLEVGDDTYTRRFGGSRVTRRDILHVDPNAPDATISADLACADQIPSERFDCIILTQTLQLIYDTRAVTATLRRILSPGGVVLVTTPGLSQMYDAHWHDSWYWGFTRHSARRLFCEAFPEDLVSVEGHGNVLAATAFLHGLAAGELSAAELDHRDPDYDLVVTVRAVSPGTPPRPLPA